jgi:hypothetical protein
MKLLQQASAGTRAENFQAQKETMFSCVSTKNLPEVFLTLWQLEFKFLILVQRGPRPHPPSLFALDPDRDADPGRGVPFGR